MKILISGGTGTVGHALTFALTEKEIIIFSRNEDAQIRMKKENPECQYIIGDIRDYQECLQATKGIDTVYHLAAMKHISRCEEQPQEAVKTNVLGTMNIVNASMENGVKDLIYLSTDKVVNPANHYGVTKLAAEKIVINANGKSKTRFSVVRSGNIWASSNSIIPILKEQILKDNKVRITKGDMTRFYILQSELVEHLISDKIKSGKIFIPEMRAFRLLDLARAMFLKYGSGKFIYEELGMMPGEKVHEYLFASHEMNKITMDKGLWINGTKGKRIDDVYSSFDFVVDNSVYNQYL
jgi:UDP-N-acetylglucosamine 4,6-dehydratase/5-epimerase